MPNARFEMIGGAEHVIWLSRENELRGLLRLFLEQQIGKAKEFNGREISFSNTSS